MGFNYQIILFGLAAFFSVAMWLDYFRKIDVFENEKIRDLIIALLIGCVTPFISLFIYGRFEDIGFNDSRDPYESLVYAIFGIGVNEELSKIVGVLIVFRVLKKRLNEPIDYLIYAGVVALGFSMVENYIYFRKYGINIIDSRAFLAALEHIINTTIIVYGYYRLVLFGKGNQLVNTLVAFVTAVSSHGMFDFFLTNHLFGIFTNVLSFGIYLVGINFWVQMLNNANNYSQFFDYKKVNHSEKLFNRLAIWYVLCLAISLLDNIITMQDSVKVMYNFVYGQSLFGALLLVVIVRVSRFKIYKQKYFDIKIQLPFYVTHNNDEDFMILRSIPIKIRGENSFEYLLTTYLHTEVTLYPVNRKKSYINGPKKAMLSEKHLLHDDVVVYELKFDNAADTNVIFFVKPKTRRITMVDEKYPIVGLYKFVNTSNSATPFSEINYQELKSLEWIYIKP